MNSQKIPFHLYMSAKIERCGFSQREIAERMGYKNPNIITMFKQGRTRFPREIIPKLANIIGIDPIRTLRMCLEEYDPKLLEGIDEYIGPMISKNERQIILKLREYFRNTDPAIDSALKDKMLKDFAEKFLASGDELRLSS